MKNLILPLILICVFFEASAQQAIITDPELRFDQRGYKCERKWVVLSRRDTSNTYTYGYIYVDEQAGFTFDLQGVFHVDDKGRYIKDTVIFKNTGSIKYRIAPNWQLVAILSQKHFKELKLPDEPTWLKIYYKYTDTLAHNFRWGFIYNDVNECELALPYLESVYKINPHYKGLEFEMAFAYNALDRFDDAIKLIEPAITNDPNNAYYYKELGYDYSHKNLFDKAINTYKRGLIHFPDERSDSKGELAFNMADAYRKLGNKEEYKNWMTKAKAYTPETSNNYKKITTAGF